MFVYLLLGPAFIEDVELTRTRKKIFFKKKILFQISLLVLWAARDHVLRRNLPVDEYVVPLLRPPHPFPPAGDDLPTIHELVDLGVGRGAEHPG